MKTEPVLIATLTNEALPETHSMCVVGDYIYVIDGRNILRLEPIKDTVWKKIWKFIKFN